MSLLMKALEKAAKDRGEARNEPAATPATAAASAPASAPAGVPPRSELALEPLRPEAPGALRPEAPRSPATPPRAAAAGAPARDAARDPAQVQASTVMQAQAATRPRSGGMGAYVRTHPLVVFGTLAALVAIAFGVYVYIQIFNPGLLVSRPAPAPKPALPPLTQAPSVPVPGTVPAAPLPSGPLLKEGASEPAAPPPAPAATARPPAAREPAEDAPRSSVSVSTVKSAPTINPTHSQAYAALQSGQVEEARRLYGQLASAEPKNVDALLGLAALAAQRGEIDEASQRYLQILELEPRHALAQSGLIALLGRADPQAAESRLKQLIAREPSAHLHFTLGNLYADQSQWAAAQQAYFQAHSLEPANPDYAYNLAVALEHISQPKLALGFYRRAAQLAAARGRANFSVPQVQERIGKLAAQVE
jgi:Flp pilus assembly protein TadD